MVFSFEGASTRVVGLPSIGIVAVAGSGQVDLPTLKASLLMGWCATITKGACRAVVLELNNAGNVSDCAYELACGDCRARDSALGDVPVAVVATRKRLAWLKAKSMKRASEGALMGAFTETEKALAWAKSRAELQEEQERYRTR